MNQFTASIWGDEGFSAILSMKSLPEIIKIIADDTSPPLWNIWEWLFFNIFGTSEIVIRSLALIFFILTIFFTYKIGELLWDKKTGFLAAVLTLLNPFFFIYAFEGRMYSILALGVAGSMYYFLRLSKSVGNKNINFAGYVLFTLWAIYSHHFAIFALFIQGLWFVYEFLKGNRKTAVTMFKAFIVVGIGYLPWLVPLYNQTSKVGGGFWLATPSVSELFGLIGKYLGAGIPHQLQFFALVLILVGLSLRVWTKKVKLGIFLLTWFLGPILLTFLVSQVFQSIFFDRYLLYTIPAAMLLLASQRRSASKTVLGILIIVLLIIDIHYFTHPTKRPFRELASYVQQTRGEKDFIINWNAGSHHLWETKYYGIGGPIYIPDGGELPFFVGTALMEENDVINELPEGIERVGVVTSGSIDDVNLPGYTEDERKTLTNINFVWYKPN